MDDYLHTVHTLKDADQRGGISSKGFPMRAILNIGMLISMSLAILMLFLGYPVISFINKSLEDKDSKLMNTGSNLGGINSTGQVAIIDSMRSGLIDPDTPKSEYTRLSQDGVTQLQLVFSDEFETPGRSFYQGDDPYWEAVDLWVSLEKETMMEFQKGFCSSDSLSRSFYLDSIGPRTTTSGMTQLLSPLQMVNFKSHFPKPLIMRRTFEVSRDLS